MNGRAELKQQRRERQRLLEAWQDIRRMLRELQADGVITSDADLQRLAPDVYRLVQRVVGRKVA